MRRKDKQLLAFVKKKKKPPPFQGKVLGGTARSRPDRKAYRHGGKVAAKADAEPISPNEPNAPAGGKVAQKFQVGGVLPRPTLPARTDLGTTWGRRGPLGPPQREKGGSVKRQDGGDVKDQANDSEDEQEDVTEYKRGGVLSAKQRQSLPSSSFALPGKGKGPKGAGAGSYPIPDESHARNALARVSQHGSSAEKATVRAKVKRKYPGIQVGG
jgi:hypothetical protein